MPLDDLRDLRRSIDTIDDDILALLDRRATAAREITQAQRDANAATYDPERERDLLARLEAQGAGRFPREAIRAVFREVMSACLVVQEPMRVAFLGPAGTFTHAAARDLFGLAVRYVEAATINGVFDAVRRGDAAHGVVPIENSTEGSVTQAVDALIEGGALIRRELVFEVNQCLMSTADGITRIERVYSHPQALAQCRVWLAKNLGSAQLVHTASTSAAARDAAADATGAAIGGRFAAELYGLPLLRDRIQDLDHNVTRFVMLGAEDAPRTGHDKTTIVFAVHDSRGALRRVLEVFDENAISLTRIESRPSKQKAWDYVFLADLEGHRDDANVHAALATLSGRCPMLRNLGSYPRFEHTPAAGPSAS
ncbi:MAG TPA: prephenate dehydratase [Gemmatimonadaceae bacterium]|nr:prephenate dehydratase [Gemmatimonadaceae bacterium]